MRNRFSFFNKITANQSDLKDYSLLPADTLVIIFSYFDLKSLTQLILVCTRFKKLIESLIVKELSITYSCEAYLRIPQNTYANVKGALARVAEFDRLAMKQKPLDDELLHYERINFYKRNLKKGALFLTISLICGIAVNHCKEEIYNQTKLNGKELMAFSFLLFMLGLCGFALLVINDLQRLQTGITLFRDIRMYNYELNQARNNNGENDKYLRRLAT